MKVERDILQDVFTVLRKKYIKKGWAIDYVDLRWGISPAESTDNKTVEICLNELERCQKLSPKPNFIILLGERRGWIPLPERIPARIAHRIITKISKEKRAIFERWYMPDHNWYPTPQYELLSQNYYGDIRLFEKDYMVLEQIFVKHGEDIYGLSATELEIDKGLSNGSSDHVIAYERKLMSVPSDKRTIFYENSSENIWRRVNLYSKVTNGVPHENIIERNITFNEYKSEKFRNELFIEFYRKISQQIDREIELNEKLGSLENEQVIHEAFIDEESRKVIERDAEITTICEWIEEKGRKDPLLIVAPSGTGKSSLLAAVGYPYIFGKHKNERNVISIFCGLTPDTSTARGTLTYLIDQLSKITGGIYNKSSHFNDNFDCAVVKDAIIKAAKHKPLLIIIDSIDRLDFGEIWKNEFFSCFPFIGYGENRLTEHEDGIRIILSSLDTKEWTSISPINPTVIDGISDCKTFVDKLLKRKCRRLTDNQNELLYNALSKCDNRPVYLVLLVALLSETKSHMYLDWIPKDLNELVELYFDWLIYYKKYDERLVKVALGLICESCGGLRHSDIMQLLGNDDEIWEKIKKDAAHQLPEEMENKRCVPSMIWSRLYYDLSPVIRSKQNSLFGETVDINHPALKVSIQKHIGSEVDVDAKVSLRKYFENLLSTQDYLALDRIISLQLQDDSQSFIGLSGNRRALATLLSPDFYIPRKTYFGNKLEDDAVMVFRQDNRAKDAQKLRRDLYWMPQENEDKMLRRVLNLPDESVAKRNISSYFQCKDLLVNLLRNNSISTTELYYLSPMKQVSMVGPDAVVGFSLKKSTFLYSSASEGEKDLGNEIVFGGRSYKIMLVEGHYLCGLRTCEDNRHAAILWDWKKECVVALWQGMTYEPLWMASDEYNGFIYVGNAYDGTYRYSFNDDRVLLSNDLALQTRSYIGDKHLAYLSNKGTYLWIIDCSYKDRYWQRLKYFKLQDYFEASKRSSGAIYIHSHAACPIIYLFIDEISRNWSVFYWDGGCVSYDWPTEYEEQEMFPKSIRYTYAVSAVWSSHKGVDHPFLGILTAFSRKRGIVFDFQKQYIMIGKDEDGYATANSLSASRDGSSICMSYGYGGRVGCYSMREVFLLKLNDIMQGKIERKTLRIPFKIDFVRLSLISDDGSVIAFATNGEEDRTVTSSKIGLINTNYPKGEAYCWKISELIFKIEFSPSGKYAYFLGGDDMALSNASLYVMDMQGHLVSSFVTKHTVMDPDMVVFEQAGKVAAWDTEIVSEGKYMHVRIYDLTNNQELRINLPKYDYVPNKSKNIRLTGVLLNSIGCLVLSAGRTLYFVDLWKNCLIEQRTLPLNMEVKAVSNDDRKLWLIDDNNNLLFYDIFTNNLMLIKEDVAAVFPSAGGTHIYTVNDIYNSHNPRYRKDTIVSYCGIDGTVIKYALLRAGAGKCCLTDNGLLITDYNNDILLFNPNV